MKLKGGLNHVVVLDFLFGLFLRRWTIDQTSIRAEHKMSKCDLVTTVLGVNHLAIVKNFDSIASVLAQLGDILAIL